MSTDQAAPASSGSSKLTLVLLVLCLGNLGAVGFVAMKVMALKSATAAADHGPPPKDAPTVLMDPPFVVNLNEPNSTRYLKVGFELELSGAAVVEELARVKKVVRDEVLRYLSSLSVADTMGEENKTRIQNEIMKRIEHVLGGGKARRLYYTEFVVQ
jgi:flagellar basal body-associated protein FliL